MTIVEGKRPFGRSVYFDGLNIKKTQEEFNENGVKCYDQYVVFQDGRGVAAFKVDFMQRAPNICIHPVVRDELQGQGIGTKIYNYAEQLANSMGKELVPSPMLSNAAANVWKKRDPNFMRHKSSVHKLLSDRK